MKNNKKLLKYYSNEHLKETKRLEQILKNKGFPLFLYCGTLLGIVREKDLITYDNDIDLIYLAKVKRSEEHTSELQSHSFISYAVFCLKKKTNSITK